MESLIVKLTIISLGASFVILLIGKWGLIEWVQMNAPELISKAFSCDFCISFWVCLLLSIIFYIFVDRDLSNLFLAFLASPITRLLI